MRPIEAILALALVALVGCDDDPTVPFEDLSEARFEAQATGALEVELAGTTYSADGTNKDELRVWVVDMDDEGGDYELFLLVRGNRIPEPGTVFDIENWEGAEPSMDEAALFLTVRTPGGFAYYRSVGGSATVTARSSDRDRAQGEFEAVLVNETSDTVRVDGRFHSTEDPDGIDSLSEG